MYVHLVMDFYHVLPSNTSPDYFPNNNASEYSTPLDNPYVLSANWEVGLMDLSYSSCINTFNNDKMVVTETCSLAECIKSTKRAYKVMLPMPTTSYDGIRARRELATSISEHFKGLLQVSIEEGDKYADWKLIKSDYYFIISQPIQDLFQLWSDVLTTMDGSIRNSYAFYKNDVPTKQSEVYIIIIPTVQSKHVTHTSYALKVKDEKITAKEFLKRFEEKVPQTLTKLTLSKDNHFRLYKLTNDNKMILMNAPLRKAMTFKHAGMFHKSYQQHTIYSFNDFKSEWVFSIITCKEIPVFQSEITRTVTLPPHSFEKESEAIAFVNSEMNDKRISFSCNTATKCITLKMTDKNLTLTLDDNLRDIFAFDKNVYSGVLTHTAKRSFSLGRCIQFLYIYSNLTEYVHIGNTKAPLLAIVPFSNQNVCSLLQQKTFKTPMYIRISQDRISQIDVAVYDGAGQLVPFVADAVTTLRLHFRQI